MPSTQRIVCFGELLWDCLPAGLFPGGAPQNVAFHLHQLGWQPIPVSAVGPDWPGAELVRRLRSAGVDTAGIATGTRPTGHVQARIEGAGEIHYRIIRDVAWDEIPLPAPRITAGARAIVFGALSQRTETNRRTLADLLARHPQAWRVFDVNLRPPHTPLARVRPLAREVDLLKVNEDELRTLTGQARGSLEARVRRLQEATGAARVCVTLGDQGAALLLGDRFRQEAGRPIRLENAVGAGDSFLAALLDGLLGSPAAASRALARACRVAEFVASQPSATPLLPARWRRAARPDR